MQEFCDVAYVQQDLNLGVTEGARSRFAVARSRRVIHRRKQMEREHCQGHHLAMNPRRRAAR